MARIVLKAKALKWGNSYGFRVAKADFERAKLQVGQEIDLQIGGETGKIDLSHVPSFNLGGGLTRREREEYRYRNGLDKLVRSGSITKAKADAEIKAWRQRQQVGYDVGD